MRSQNINKQNYVKNETEYEESLITNEVPRYFNRYKCGKNILNRLDVEYEWACMATTTDEYYTNMLEMLVICNDCNNGPLSNVKIQQSVRRVTE